MNEYIKSPINYVGNKYRLIKQIIPLFPKKISMFVDAFGGSGTVLMNTEADYYIYNDINPYVSSIVSGLFSTSYDEIIKQIENIISEYDLSMINKEGFERLRDSYNNGRKDWITLYTLMCHSFNHQFRFNNKHEYNSSFGKNRSYFSDRQKQDLLALKHRFENKDPIIVSSKNAFDFDFSDFDENDLIYFDPPYANTTTYQGQKFDTNEFWNYMREISKDNKVFISEQNAPDDFECIWEKPFTRTLDRNKNNQFKVTEKLFIYKNSTPLYPR